MAIPLTKSAATISAPAYSTGAARESALERAAAAFAWAAVVAILFNTGLAWIKDSYDPLNTFMASLTGHHWITHGLADLVVFGAVGWLVMAKGKPSLDTNVVIGLAIAVVVGGAGLAGWFFLL
jgi:hypothetical protein